MRITLFLLIICSSALCSEYKGFGRFIINDNIFNCEKVYFSYERKQNQLIINKGHYTCENQNGVYRPRNFEVRQNQLFENNTYSGQITSKGIVIKDPMNSNYEMFIKHFNGKTFVVESFSKVHDEILVGVLERE